MHAGTHSWAGSEGGGVWGGGDQAAVPIRDREFEHGSRLAGIIMLLRCLFFSFVWCCVLI